MNSYISTLKQKDGLLISEFLAFLTMGTGGIETGGIFIPINEKLIQIMCSASNLRIGVVHRWSLILAKFEASVAYRGDAYKKACTFRGCTKSRLLTGLQNIFCFPVPPRRIDHKFLLRNSKEYVENRHFFPQITLLPCVPAVPNFCSPVYS